MEGVAMIPRDRYTAALENALRRSPVTALLGPRQCGKTTLSRLVAAGHAPHAFFDLESPQDLQRLQNPELMLGSLSGLVVIDEIQLRPDLFAVLRVLVDRPGAKTRFLILGSASPQLRAGASESLAGRVEFVDLTGFNISEVGAANVERLWLRGGFPRAYLAESEDDSAAWREGFIRTFLQRDLPQFGVGVPAPVMRRFWTMLAHYHGQTWNASEIARSLGQSDKTIRGYLDTLTDTYMVRQLQPWFENLGKRQVKAPKVYLRDSGLLHRLLMLDNRHALTGHPKVGASWEGFALEQVLGMVQAPQAYFWSVHGGPELDLLLWHEGRRYGVEFKYSEAPATGRSMHSAVELLGLERLWVIVPIETAYPVTERIAVCSLSDFMNQWCALA